jgi:hypothetical protein
MTCEKASLGGVGKLVGAECRQLWSGDSSSPLSHRWDRLGARTRSASAPASKRSAPSAIAPNELRAWWRARRRKQERPLDPHPVDLDQQDAGESAGTGGNDLVGAIIEIGRDKGINLRRSLTSASVWAKCETCGHQAGMNVDVLAETLVVPIGGSRVALQSLRGQFNTRPAWHTSREAWGVGGRTRR